jgi:hypothetical protein
VTSGNRADGNHLDAVNGGKVFDEEKAAEQSLMAIKSPKPAVKTAMPSLDAVDQSLAQTAIDDAVAALADRGQIEAARKEMAAAQHELSKAHFDTAIDRWKAAWRVVTGLPPAAE